jgi:hypothetical protein
MPATDPDLLYPTPDDRRPQLALEGELPVGRVVDEQERPDGLGGKDLHYYGPAGEVLRPRRYVQVRLPHLPDGPPARDGDALPDDGRDLVVAPIHDRLLGRHQVGGKFAEALGELRPTLVPRAPSAPQVERGDAHPALADLIFQNAPPRPLTSPRASRGGIADQPGEKTAVWSVRSNRRVRDAEGAFGREH